MDIPSLRSTEFYRKLTSVNDSREGNLLEYSECAELQLNFISHWIEKVNPYRILETGTNKCLFAYCLDHLFEQGFIFTSFDKDSRAARCASVFNSYSRHSLMAFVEGDSKVTLSRYNGTVDLAWIDGGHDYETALSDIRNAMRLGAKVILCDDSSGNGVSSAIATALENSTYQMADRSADNRIIVALYDNR